MKQLFLLAALLAVTPAAAAPFAEPGQPIVVGRSYEVPSNRLGEARRVNIMLPPGYDDPKQREARYPVLYLLDGGTDWQDFFHIAGLVHQGSLWGVNEPMIVVGVESKDRRREFTTPSADAKERADFPTHGGADAFRAFLADELMPAVNGAYRTNGVDGLIGESLAGLFVVDTALRAPGSFDRFIAISPSLWWSGGALAKQATALLATPSPRTLWLSIADEGGTMQAGMDRLVAALRASPKAGVRWTYAPLPDEKHSTIYHPAATRAIRAVFPAPASPTE